MLNNGGAKWAQVGWWKLPGGARRAFVQWTDNAGHWFTETFAASPIGQTPNYETIYNPGANPKFLFERNNAVLWQANALWQPATVQTMGEVHNRADQMPGGVTAQLFLMEAHYTMGAGWININGPAFNSDWNQYGTIKVTEEFYAIWDKKCQT